MCGCRGWSACDSLFRFMDWCFGVLARGTYPAWRNEDGQRRALGRNKTPFNKHALVQQGKLNTSPRLGSLHEVRAHTDHERKSIGHERGREQILLCRSEVPSLVFRQRQISKGFRVVTTRRRRTGKEYSAALAQFPSRISTTL